MTAHSENFASALSAILQRSDVRDGIEATLKELVALRERRGRLFVLGVGGGAANAAHAVNDFRKLCGIEAYAPTDSIAELTARANDEGWHTIFSGWLRASGLTSLDAILVFSVGGGTDEVSVCIGEALGYAKGHSRARVLGVVGRTDGHTAKLGDAVVVVGRYTELGSMLTPLTETVQLAVLHILVSDPRLQTKETKW